MNNLRNIVMVQPSIGLPPIVAEPQTTPLIALPGQVVDFVLVTAHTEERDAVLNKLGHLILPDSKADAPVYFQAAVPVTFPDGSTGAYQVIILCLAEMEREQAAAATAEVIRQWQPRYTLLVGTASGLATRGVKAGDILLSSQIIDYEVQNQPHPESEVPWIARQVDEGLLEASNSLSDECWQKLMFVKRPGRGGIQYHIGSIASVTPKVVSGDVVKKYQGSCPSLVGVEMETGGAAAAAFQAADSPKIFMVCAVSGLADKGKDAAGDTKWRSYASDAVAAYAVALLQSAPVPLAESARQVDGSLEEGPTRSIPVHQPGITRVVGKPCTSREARARDYQLPGYLDIQARWYRNQGHRVTFSKSCGWVEFAKGVFQAFPYHWVIEPDEAEIRDLMNKNWMIALKYSTPITAPFGQVSYHVVYDKPTYTLAELPKKARHDVNKGLQYASFEPISVRRLAYEGWELHHDTLVRQGREQAEDKECWENICLSAEGIPGFEPWAAIHDGELVAALLSFTLGDTVDIFYQQSKTEHLPFGVNNALTYAFTNAVVQRPGIRHVFYGLHSLDAAPGVDQYKLRMGYTAKPVRQRVVFHPYLQPFAGSLTRRVLQEGLRLWPSSCSLHKAEGMFRFYTEGNHRLSEQTWPEALAEEKDLLLAQLEGAGQS